MIDKEISEPKLLILSYPVACREWMGDSIEEARKMVDRLFDQHHPEIHKVEIIDRNSWKVIEKHTVPHPRWNDKGEKLIKEVERGVF